VSSPINEFLLLLCLLMLLLWLKLLLLLLLLLLLFWLLHKVQASDNNKFIIANSSHECV